MEEDKERISLKLAILQSYKFRFLVFAIMLVFSGDLPAQTSAIASIDFSRADSVAALYPDHSIANLKLLSDKLTLDLPTEEEKFRAIYRWVCDNIKNDYTLFTRNKQKRQKLKDDTEALEDWNRKVSKHAIKKLREDHSTLCTGYAYLVKDLAYHAGITCEIINGYGRTVQSNIGCDGFVNHSWNAVKLDNQWYLCDPTWSSGNINAQKGMFVAQFFEGYFLAEPSIFVCNHYPVDSSWIFLDQKPTLEEFLNGPLIYKSALSHNVLPQSPATFDVSLSKGEKLTIQFSKLDTDPPGEVRLELVKGTDVKSVTPEVQQRDRAYAVNHIFDRKGPHAVHLLVDGDYVLTYDVRVVK